MDAIRRPKDFLTGLMFAVIGVGVILIAREYPFGTARQMGPGFFPVVLAAILLLFAAILIVRAFLGERDPIGDFAVGPALYVLGSALLFSLLLRPAGMLVAIVVMVAIASQAKRTLSPGKSLLVGAILAGGSAILFVNLLGQNIPLLGTWFGS
jgi:putative tricarboxylic transport membrane protein